ncbi:MAG: MCE family protein [Ignavibacteria bacterium]|nr:MCE family protein [Ignavibacteria bacterium]
MQKKISSEFKVGLFVFAAAFIVILAIFWAKGFSVGLTMQEYVVYFPKVSGLNEGDQVSLNGVRKGKIDKIELQGDSVKISFSIDKEIKIKKDYYIYVAVTELTGGKVLYIEPGKSTAEVPPGTPLLGTPGADFSSLMNSFGDLTTDVKLLIGEFKKSTENLNVVIANVNDIVGDEGLKNSIKSTVNNLSATSQNLNQLVNESRSGINGLTTQAGNTLESIDLSVGDNGKELKNTLLEIQTLTSTIDTLAVNLNKVVNDINNKEKGIGKFLTDDEFFNNINTTLSEIEKLSKNIRKNGVKLNIF